MWTDQSVRSFAPWTDHCTTGRSGYLTTPNGNRDMNLLRISATSHGINYLPEYVAAGSGAFAARGVEVVAVARDPWTGTLDDLAAGEADLVLGGVWVPAMYAGMGRDLVAVGQLNARFPMTIVTREPVEDFSWEWLTGRTVLAPSAGGTAPYEFTAGVMREHGIDPSTIKFVRDLSTAMLRELYEHGLGDAMIADPLTASELELAGLGHSVCRLADVAGPMPNSVYYTDRSRLDELHEACVALMGGIQDAMRDLRAGARPGGCDRCGVARRPSRGAPRDGRNARRRRHLVKCPNRPRCTGALVLDSARPRTDGVVRVFCGARRCAGGRQTRS